MGLDHMWVHMVIMPSSAQDELILAHLWIVKSVAHSLKSSLLFSADWDELISAGNLALVKAGRRFMARNGCQFKTYAYKVVRGEMLRSFTRISGHHNSAMIEFEPLIDAPVAPVQEQKTYAAERAAIFNNLVSRLQPRHREVIAAYVGGGSLVQMARRKGVKRDRLMKW